jgi:hypothetical protein
MKCTRIGEKTCNCSCFEIDQEMDAILLIIDIVYGVCRIVIKSVQQCRYLRIVFFLQCDIFYNLFLFETTCAISAEIVSSNLGRGQEYLIQQYVITFVSDLRQVGCVSNLSKNVKGMIHINA